MWRELDKAFLGCGFGRGGVDGQISLAIWSQYLRGAMKGIVQQVTTHVSDDPVAHCGDSDAA
jgi:hypothetical protein